MGCCSGNRKKQTREFAEQRWEYINLQDFKAGGCGAPFAYGYLWFSLILSIAVYAVDSFTAVQLIAFNRWSSKIEPAIPLKISKWIFSICIVLSFINLAYEAVRAWRVIRRGNVAECYMDSLAARWESIRVGQGQGWRRFLVFAALTKSKKGAEYVALFTYFSFQAWIRILLCSAPRQVVNAFTLKSVYVAKLSTNTHSLEGNFTGFFDKIGALAKEDYRQAAILSGMAFTFVIWVFSVIYFLLAILFYVFFLFHWIPRADGGLTGYCERKVNKKLLKIVTKKVNKALAKNQENMMKAQLKAAKRTGEKPEQFTFERTATLPNISPLKEDGLPEMPVLARTGTGGSLPPYASRPPSPGSIEMNELGQTRYGHTRTGSGASYSANAPLISSAADMGYSNIPPTGMNGYGPRPGTAGSQRGYGPRPGMGPSYGNPGAAIPPSKLSTVHNANPTIPNLEGPGIPPSGAAGAPTIPDVALNAAPPPGHDASLRLGTPTIPNVNMAGSAAYGTPTIPAVALGGAPPQRAPTSNSQRSLNSNGSKGHSSKNSGSSMGASVSPMEDGPGGVSSYYFDAPRSETPAQMTPAPQQQAAYSRGAPPQRQYQPYTPGGYGSQPPASQNPYDGAQDPRRFPPTRSATGPVPPRGPPHPPQRSVTGPGPMPPRQPTGYSNQGEQGGRRYAPTNMAGPPRGPPPNGPLPRGPPSGPPPGRGNGYNGYNGGGQQYGQQW